MSFKYTNANSIKAKCKVAMKLWGYKLLMEDEDLETFQPVIDLEHFKL